VIPTGTVIFSDCVTARNGHRNAFHVQIKHTILRAVVMPEDFQQNAKLRSIVHHGGFTKVLRQIVKELLVNNHDHRVDELR
jgi:hypothetical protein